MPCGSSPDCSGQRQDLIPCGAIRHYGFLQEPPAEALSDEQPASHKQHLVRDEDAFKI